MNEASESGISYDDIPYVSYEYPKMYRNQIAQGERFVYYRGRRRAAGGRQRQVYLGTGVVGDVRPSGRDGRLVCAILDGEPFAEPVDFRATDGTPLEPGGIRRGYYQRGVRRIDDDTYNHIVQLGGGPNAGSPTVRPTGQHATADTARRVEEYSRQMASAWLRREWGCDVTPMATNNPGFDLRVDHPRIEFVEVKGTQAPAPRFLLSEGERAFAHHNADHYALIVVYGISLPLQSHTGIECRVGPIERYANLTPTQWAGRVAPPRTQTGPSGT